MQHHEYLRHQKGLTLLWLWMDQWKDVSGWHFENSEIKLSQLTSQRFCFGLPKSSKKRVKSPAMFLGVQREEAQWLKRIDFQRAVWDDSPSAPILWLVSASRQSPDKAWPDLPALAIGLKLNTQTNETLRQWNGNALDWRSVWWDDDNVSHVGMSPLGRLSLSLGSLEDKWSNNARHNIRTLKDVVRQRLQESSVDFDPGFAGPPPELNNDQQSILAPFKDEAPAHIIESDYPEIFGQFLEEPQKGKRKR